jgi:hypothetical protein
VAVEVVVAGGYGRTHHRARRRAAEAKGKEEEDRLPPLLLQAQPIATIVRGRGRRVAAVMRMMCGWSVASLGMSRS